MRQSLFKSKGPLDLKNWTESKHLQLFFSNNCESMTWYCYGSFFSRTSYREGVYSRQRPTRHAASWPLVKEAAVRPRCLLLQRHSGLSTSLSHPVMSFVSPIIQNALFDLVFWTYRLKLCNPGQANIELLQPRRRVDGGCAAASVRVNHCWSYRPRRGAIQYAHHNRVIM